MIAGPFSYINQISSSYEANCHRNISVFKSPNLIYYMVWVFFLNPELKCLARNSKFV